MSVLQVTLFGPVRFTHELGVLPGINGTNAGLLLVYLILYPDRLHHREILTEAIWGSGSVQPPKKGHRQALYELRKRLSDANFDPGQFIHVEGDYIALSDGAPISVDLWQFNRLLDQADRTQGDGEWREHINQALDIYTDGLATDCFHDWCLLPRQTACDRFILALEKLMFHHMSHKEWDEAIHIGKRILNTDPLLEYIHRALMESYYLKGSRASALKQFHECARALEAFFDEPVSPMQETTELYARIRNEQRLTSAAERHAKEFRKSHASRETARAKGRPSAIASELRRLADRLENGDTAADLL
jgi:DNA-binding SARP family transcriptional activator